MKFTEHRDSNVFAVKNYQPGKVKVNNLIFTDSFFMTQHKTQEHWACHDIDELNESLLTQLINEHPEVIVLGSGETQKFPDMKLFAYCAKHGIGLEVMANDAACRTYNVLTTEDRDIVLALIMQK